MQPIKLIDVHIPKTAGVSLYVAISKVFGQNSSLMLNTSEKIKKFNQMTEEARNGYQFISGHLPLTIFTKKKLIGYKYITIVRDPLARMVSLYNYLASNEWHPFHSMAKDKSFEEYVLSFSKKGDGDNNQCRFICGRPSFEDAKDVVDSVYALCAPMDYLDSFSDELARIIGKGKLNLEVRNKTAGKLKVGDLDKRAVSLVESITKNDRLIFDYVKKKYEKTYMATPPGNYCDRTSGASGAFGKTPKSGKITFDSDTHCSVNGIALRYTSSDYSIRTNEQEVAILKSRPLLEFYETFIHGNSVKNVLEVGISEGGMPVLLTALKDDLRYTGIELNREAKGLTTFLSRHDELSSRIAIHYEVGQDCEAWRRIAEHAAQTDPIDLIVDGTSHLCAYSKQIFELLFPFLGKGCLYIVEDGGWLHWKGFTVDHCHRTGSFSNLLSEIVAACACCPQYIKKVEVFPSHFIVTKGEASLPASFSLDEIINTNNRKFAKI